MTEKKSTINILQLGLGGLLVVAAFMIGSLWTKVQVLEKGADGNSQGAVVQSGDGAKEPAKNIKVDPVTDSDYVRGDRNARVALIEYSDLECPFCKQFHETAKQAVDEYDGKLMWVYRHFPIDELHSKARKEAEAAECAGELGGQEAFWAMLDKIYEVTPSNNGLDLATLPDLAEQIGINKTQFIECLDSGKFASRVQEDWDSGSRAGVSGTPGNILLDTKTSNTSVFPGAVPLPQIKTAVDALLAE